ncbi:MAG: hypothetical protein IKT40_09505 [Bacilli bacterium]|nr:hypothetical protein [Bacilli bacterium]
MTPPCFIRKNNIQLRNKLEEFGFEKNPYVNDIDNEKKFLCVFPNKQHNYVSYLTGNKCVETIPKIIDCGYNEDLFLAIAALNNNKSDKYKWFICKEEYISSSTLELVKVGTWQLNTQHDKLSYSLKRLWKKATLKEILEHFNYKK